MGFLDSIREITSKLSYTKAIELEGVRVLMGLLTVKEEQIVNSASEEDDSLEGMAYINDLRKRVLSYAIKEIGGEEIPAIVEYMDGEKLVKKTREIYLYEFLSSLPSAGVDILFEAYSDLKDEVEDNIEGKIKVNWYLTPEEREERRKKEMMARRNEAAELGLGGEGEKDIEFREIKNPDEEEDSKDTPDEKEAEQG
jgi:hypothetical protein